MELDISAAKAFTYRNSPGLRSFNINKDYVYSVTVDRIIQTPKHSNTGISCELPFQVIGTLVHNDMIYLSSKDSLYYFDGNLNMIQPREPLSLDFSFGIYIVNVSEKVMTFFNAQKKKIVHSLRVEGSSGICSASYVDNEDVYLGYESGDVFLIRDFINLMEVNSISLIRAKTEDTVNPLEEKIKNSMKKHENNSLSSSENPLETPLEEKIKNSMKKHENNPLNPSENPLEEKIKNSLIKNEETPLEENGKNLMNNHIENSVNPSINDSNHLSMNQSYNDSIRCAVENPNGLNLIYLKEPVVSITKVDEFLIISTVYGHILKLKPGEKKFKYTKLGDCIRKIVGYKSVMVLASKESMLFMDHSLKILRVYFPNFRIIDFLIDDDTLYISHENGLIMEYRIKEIVQRITV